MLSTCRYWETLVFVIFIYSILFDMCEEESRELSESRKGHIDF